MAANEVNALLGKGSEFEGKLTFDGTVRIDGRFRGEIYSEETLIVGESARVEASIDVDTIVIYGEVIGNIRAKTCVELHAPARLAGNIVTANLQVDKGVVWNGQCQMAEAKGAPSLKSDVVPVAHPVHPTAERREPPASLKGFSVVGGDDTL